MPKLSSLLQTKKNRKNTKLVLITGLILGVILLGFFSIDLDSLRKPIIKELSKITGLAIEIKSLKFSFSSGLSLRGSDLKVSSKDNSQQIFSAKKIFLNAKLKSLMKGQLEIRKIILVNPIMNVNLYSKTDLSDSREISNNMISLNQGATVKPKSLENYESTGIPGIEKSLFVTLLNLFKNQILSLRTIEIRNAELLFAQSKSNLLPAKNTPIGLSARLDLINPTPNEINIKGDIFQLEIEGLNFSGKLEANDLLAKELSIKAKLESTPISAKLINAITKTLSKKNSMHVEFISGQIEKLFIDLKGSIDSNGNLIKEIVIKSGFGIEGIEVLIPKIKTLGSMDLYNINANGAWENGILNYKVNGMLWDGTIESDIVVNLPDLLRGSLTGTYNSKTKFKELDISSIRFNSLDKWTPITGTANGSIKTQDSLNNTIQTSGKLKINDLSLKNKIPYTVKQATISFSKKSPRKTLARIRFDDLQLNNIFLNSFSSLLQLSPEKFLFNNGRIIPLNGVILFSGDYRRKPNTYVLRFNGKKIVFQDFLKEQLEGSGFFKGMFQGNFNTAKIIQQKGKEVNFSHLADGLSGKFRFGLKNGHINSSLWMRDKVIPSLSPLAVITKNIGLRYDELTGEFKAWKGKVSTKNFKLKGQQINLAASGSANLVNRKIDGKVKVTSNQLLNTLTKEAPLLSDIFKNDLKNTLTEKQFNLEGTWEKPIFILRQ
jgi:hypothetical protein